MDRCNISSRNITQKCSNFASISDSNSRQRVDKNVQNSANNNIYYETNILNKRPKRIARSSSLYHPLRRMSLTSRLFSLTFMLLLIFSPLTLTLSLPQLNPLKLSCPPVNLIHRLATPNRANTPTHHSESSHLHSSGHQVNHTKPECDCTTLQEGGWEINCYHPEPESSSLVSGPDTGLGDEYGSSSKLELGDYGIEFNILKVSFSVRYLFNKHVTITCDLGSPAFKPALFQGKYTFK